MQAGGPAAGPPIGRDVAIIIYSRNRPERLRHLLDDLHGHYGASLRAAGLTYCVWVYAQAYSAAYLAELACDFADQIRAGDMAVVPALRAHATIGDVAHTAIRIVHEGCLYRLAMLMDDDSVYGHHPCVDANLRHAARTFLDSGHRAYSIKLGSSATLAYQPFLDPDGPIMPFREKMLWVSRAVLDEVLATPRFAELSIGEDSVIAAVAWLGGPDSCFGVHGMATFLHLGFETSAEFQGHVFGGGYAELTLGAAADEAEPRCKYEDALRNGVTPHHVLPHIFVPEGHPHFDYNGVRAELVAAIRAGLPPSNPLAGPL